MTWPAALLAVGAFAAGLALIVPAARRTGLGVWHPAIAWLALEAVFFGVGSIVLAIDGRPGPGLFLSASVGAFGLAVSVSDRVARSRGDGGLVAGIEPSVSDGDDPAAVSWPIAVGLAVIAVLGLAPILLASGLPFLTEDITGARSEVAGIPVQLIRVALPGLAVALAIRLGQSRPASPRRLAVIGGAIALILAFDVALASRYLALELIAAIAIAFGLLRRQVRWRSLAVAALIAVAAFGGIQIVRAYDQAAGHELAFAIDRTVNRVVLIQPRTIEALQAAIPAETAPFGGLTWLRRAGPILGRDDIPNLGYWVYARLFPEQTAPGYAAPGLLGEAWANFAALGFLLFVPFGVAVERLGAVIARRRNGTADLVAGALAILFVARTHALGLNGLVLLLVLVVVWRLMAGGGVRGFVDDLGRVLRWR